MSFSKQTFWKCVVVTPADIVPLNGSWSPEWVVASRHIGDVYIDNDTGVRYVNPTIWTTWRQVDQTA